LDIALPAEGVFHNLVFVSIKKTHPHPNGHNLVEVVSISEMQLRLF